MRSILKKKCRKENKLFEEKFEFLVGKFCFTFLVVSSSSSSSSLTSTFSTTCFCFGAARGFFGSADFVCFCWIFYAMERCTATKRRKPRIVNALVYLLLAVCFCFPLLGCIILIRIFCTLEVLFLFIWITIIEEAIFKFVLTHF